MYFTPFILIIILFTVNFQGNTNSNSDPSKKAFLIAIANYPKGGGWDGSNPLSSLNDLIIIKESLKKQGFVEANIMVVKEENATKIGVMNAFNDFKKMVKLGDKVIFHFSGHGQQVYDFSGDEPDQLDEALVLYDSPATRSNDASYKGNRHLIDDEINIMFNSLRQIVGVTGHIVAFLDACHSGTASRGNAKRRGGIQPFVPENFEISKNNIEESGTGLVDEQKARGNLNNLGKLVVFGGSASNQVNYEITDAASKISYGSLSYSMSKAFALLKPNTTYRQFFAQIVNTVTSEVPSQTPMAEGNIDNIFFEGNVANQTPYFTIEKIENNLITLEAGTLYNLQPNTKITFYTSGTQNPELATPIGNGVVISSSPLNAEVKLNNLLSSQITKSAIWAFVTEYSMQNLNLKIYNQNINNLKLQTIKLKLKTLKHLNWVTTMNEADVIITENPASNELNLIDSKTLLPFGKNVSIEKLPIKLETFAKVKMLKGFSGEAEELKVDLSLNILQNGSKCGFENKKSETNLIKNIKVGQPACLCMKNQSKIDLFVTIVEFWADGTLHQQYPEKNKPEDALKPGKEKILTGKVSIDTAQNEPIGQHIIKIFVTTKKQLDFTSIEDAQARGKFQKIHPLEAFMYQSRGLGSLKDEDEDKIYTQTLIYNLQN